MSIDQHSYGQRRSPFLFNDERLTFTETIIILSLFCGATFILVCFRDGFVFALTLTTIQVFIIIALWIVKNAKNAQKSFYSLFQRRNVI